MNKKVFIDSDVNILTGDEAARALQRENDEKYFDENEGISRVGKERWLTAQKAEKKHWMSLGIRAADDRNYEHADKFEGYKAIKGASFRHAIELGCGPFTNLRLIGGIANIAQCSLLDPLIDEYLSHPQCRYKRGKLIKDAYFRSPWMRVLCKGFWRALPRGIRGFLPGIPLLNTLKMPIEEMPLNETYDLVVMINVIEHCYDIHVLMNNILRILKQDGVFIFHDRLYDAAVIRERVKEKYDAAHPLRVDRALLLDFLQKNFSPLFDRRDEIIHNFEGREEKVQSVYFIGRKSQ